MPKELSTMPWWHVSGAERDEMAQVFSFAPALTASLDELARVPIPARFRATVERHQQNLTALAAALRLAGVTPEQAAGCVDVALSSFRESLADAMAKVEDRDDANF